ncbi:hypothetical protein MBLNU230_g6546t1 [Neophaeotheca triangularis]
MQVASVLRTLAMDSSGNGSEVGEKRKYSDLDKGASPKRQRLESPLPALKDGIDTDAEGDSDPPYSDTPTQDEQQQEQSQGVVGQEAVPEEQRFEFPGVVEGHYALQAALDRPQPLYFDGEDGDSDPPPSSDGESDPARSSVHSDAVDAIDIATNNPRSDNTNANFDKVNAVDTIVNNTRSDNFLEEYGAVDTTDTATNNPRSDNANKNFEAIEAVDLTFNNPRTDNFLESYDAITAPTFDYEDADSDPPRSIETSGAVDVTGTAANNPRPDKLRKSYDAFDAPNLDYEDADSDPPRSSETSSAVDAVDATDIAANNPRPSDNEPIKQQNYALPTNPSTQALLGPTDERDLNPSILTPENPKSIVQEKVAQVYHLQAKKAEQAAQLHELDAIADRERQRLWRLRGEREARRERGKARLRHAAWLFGDTPSSNPTHDEFAIPTRATHKPLDPSADTLGGTTATSTSTAPTHQPETQPEPKVQPQSQPQSQPESAVAGGKPTIGSSAWFKTALPPGKQPAAQEPSKESSKATAASTQPTQSSGTPAPAPAPALVSAPAPVPAQPSAPSSKQNTNTTSPDPSKPNHLAEDVPEGHSRDFNTNAYPPKAEQTMSTSQNTNTNAMAATQPIPDDSVGSSAAPPTSDAGIPSRDLPGTRGSKGSIAPTAPDYSNSPLKPADAAHPVHHGHGGSIPTAGGVPIGQAAGEARRASIAERKSMQADTPADIPQTSENASAPPNEGKTSGTDTAFNNPFGEGKTSAKEDGSTSSNAASGESKGKEGSPQDEGEGKQSTKEKIKEKLHIGSHK